MRTISKVHTVGERTEQRASAQRGANQAMLRLLAVTSILRTVLTQLLPLVGSAGWWAVPVCLAPGLAACGLGAALLRRTGTTTLQEAVRASLGRIGLICLCAALAALVLLDGAASMTALITMFTQGIGTEGTQVTMALFTAGAMLFCLTREGLPRGIWLLRWPLLAGWAIVAAQMALQARADGLYPVLGDGWPAIRTALVQGSGLGWPLLLTLTVSPPQGKRRLRPLLPGIALCCAAVLLLCLGSPHERLTRGGSLSEHLLEFVLPLPAAHRTLAQCLMMLMFFLSIAASAVLAADAVSMPWRGKGWSAGAVVVLLALTQCADVRALWQWLAGAQRYALLPLLALITAGIIGFRFRRRNV